MATTVKTQRVGGQQCIGVEALVKCNTRYHKPYLAVVDPTTGEYDWQPKEYIGYGKHAAVYYDVSNLKPGDLIVCAGGSGGNTYPLRGRVVERTEDTLTVESISDLDWSNIIPRRKSTNRV